MEREEDKEARQERVASVYFALIGIGYLFPFSAMSQPADYWRLLFPDFNVLFYISAVFMYTNLILLTYLVFFTRENSNQSFIWRIYGGFGGQLLALIIVPTSYFFSLDEHWNIYMVLGCTCFMALVTAFLDSSVIALSGCFNVRCQESLQLGVGLSTLIGCIYRLITKIAFPATNDGTIVSSLIYFYTGSLTIVACIICFFFLLRMPLTQKRLQARTRWELAQGVDENIDDIDILSDANNDGAVDDDELVSEKSSLLGLIEGGQIADTHVFLSADFSKYDAWRKSLMNGLCITFLFLTTLAVWPALITELPTHQFPDLQKGQWWSLILLSLFALMDVVGRFAVSFRFGVNRRNIWLPVVLRTLFIPLLVMAVKSILFTHDAWSILFVVVLGWTNGWCGSLTILLMNECGETDQERRYIGTLASFYLNGGLVLGSTIGLLIEAFK